MRHYSIDWLRGQDVARRNLDTALWMSLPDKIKRNSLWDVPYAERLPVLGKSIARSPFALIAFQDDAVCGACWTTPVCANARTANTHFIINVSDPDERRYVGAWAVNLCLSEFDCLLGIIPRPLRGSRKFVESLGFEKVAELPGACWLDLHGRLTDGILYQARAE